MPQKVSLKVISSEILGSASRMLQQHVGIYLALRNSSSSQTSVTSLASAVKLILSSVSFHEGAE